MTQYKEAPGGVIVDGKGNEVLALMGDHMRTQEKADLMRLILQALNGSRQAVPAPQGEVQSLWPDGWEVRGPDEHGWVSLYAGGVCIASKSLGSATGQAILAAKKRKG